MRILLTAAAVGSLAALALPVLPSSAADAQRWGHRDGRGYYGNSVARERRECARELRRADSRREYRRELRECRREIAQARRDRYDDRRYRRGYYGYDRGYRDRYWDGYRWRYRY